MYNIQHRCMSLKVDVSRTTLIYVIFEFVLLRITIIYLTKHRCIHVRNFVRKKPPYQKVSVQHFDTSIQSRGWLKGSFSRHKTTSKRVIEPE